MVSYIRIGFLKYVTKYFPTEKLRFTYLAARVENHVPLDPCLHQVPLPVGHIVTQVSLIAGIH